MIRLRAFHYVNAAVVLEAFSESRVCRTYQKEPTDIIEM